jgi:hypothetical protein
MNFNSLSALQAGFAPGLSTALYASAGADTKALVFTHPEFYEHRSVTAVAPEFFIYVDRAPPATLSFQDAHTTIAGQSQSGSVAGLPATFMDVTVTSDRYANRTLKVAYIQAENTDVGLLTFSEQWAPDTFIGVTDGCRFGGNLSCVNNLSRLDLSPAQAAAVKLPKWWITDHFVNHEPFDELRDGDVVRSADPLFPVAFHKLALLSGDFGRYGRGAIRGATIFEVVIRPS